MAKKRKLLGYGMFSSSTWDMKYWKFETVVGIHPTKEEARIYSKRVSHCLHREFRRIYNVSRLNIGHHDKNSSHFVNAEKWLKNNKKT